MKDHETLIIHSSGGYRAEISRRGGSIAWLTLNGLALIESNLQDAEAAKGANLMLAPWPNRLDKGTFTWKGQERKFPVTETERNNALHGLVHLKMWDVVSHGDSHVTLATDIPEWPAKIEVTYSLSAKGLDVAVRASTQAESVPFAWGWHPYFNALETPLDECSLELDAQYNLILDSQRLLPTGETQPAEQVLPAADETLAGVNLDHAFKVTPGSVVRLKNPRGHGVAITMSNNLKWLQIYTPDDYPGRGRSIAIEPMSAPPNALATGTDIHELTPESPFNCHISISAF